MQQQQPEQPELLDEGYRLPITFRQRQSKLKKLTGLLAMSVLAGFVVVPQIGLAVYALMSPELRSALAAQPIAAIELAIAFTFWAALVCWPLRNIIAALISDRIVGILGGEVMVIDRTPLSTRRWRMPLAAFDGVAVRTRTSLSSVHREIVLVHPRRKRSIVLATAETFGYREIQELCDVLGLPLLSPVDRAGVSGPSDGHKFDAGLAPARA